MEYFKKRSICLTYYGVILRQEPLNALVVIDGESGYYTIERTNIPCNGRHPCSKEEFETAYNNAINSFKPFIDAP